MRVRRSCLLALLWAGSAGPAPAVEPGLRVVVMPPQIYLGDSFNAVITVSGAANVAQPEISLPTNCTVAEVAGGPENRYRVEYADGAVRTQILPTRIFRYRITPLRSGRFALGRVRVMADNRRLDQAGPAVMVVGIETQDSVKVAVAVSRDSLMVSEPLDVTVTVTLRRLSGEFADADPLDPDAPPRLGIPYFGPPVPGFRVPDVTATLQPRLVSRTEPGFAINDYAVRAATLSSVDPLPGEEVARFALDRRAVLRGSVPCFEYALRLRFVPQREGRYAFGPVSFKGPIVASTPSSARGELRPVYAVAPACPVSVVSPPAAGRPDAYVGAVGSGLVARASLDTRECRVGDPVTLTLTLSGSVGLDNTYAPPLSSFGDLAQTFRIEEHRGRVTQTEAARTFEFTLRPVQTGTQEIPSLPIAYYDAGARIYKTVFTQPLPLQVTPGPPPGFEPAQTIGPGDARRISPLALAPLNVDPRGSGDLRSEVTLVRILLLALAGPAVFFLTLALLRRQRHLPYRRLQDRRARAYGRARREIRHARSGASRHAEASRRQAVAAMRRYLAERFHAPETSLTPADVADTLGALALPPAVAESFRTVFERMFNAVYGDPGTPAELRTDCDEAMAAMKAIEAAAGKPADDDARRSRIRPRRSPVGLTMIASLALAGAFSCSADDARDFMWEEANSRMATAHTRGDFLAAAEAYGRLVHEGGRNGPLFYNLGTALLQAGQYDAARTAFRRAERYMGSDPDLRRNQMILRIESGTPEAVSNPFFRTLLFWHFHLGLAARLTLSLVFFAVLWMALTLWVLGRRSTAVPLIWLSAIALAVFASSSATTWYQERGEGDRPVIVAPGGAETGTFKN